LPKTGKLLVDTAHFDDWPFTAPLNRLSYINYRDIIIIIIIIIIAGDY